MLDYPLGVLLILSPWIFAFDDASDAAVTIPIVIGALMIAQSLITDWELSIARIVPLPIHLMMDVVAGVFLAASPFIFGFSDEGTNAWLPHVLVGIGLVGAGLLTRTAPSERRTRGATRGPIHH